MNELIKKLAKQADPDYTGEYTDDMNHAIIGNDAIQKFTELIIDECIDVILEVLPSVVFQSKNGIHPTWHIKDHFGLE